MGKLTFIKELRKRMGLTQEQFARKLNVSFTTVSRWERGCGKPSPLAKVQIEKLSSELNKNSNQINKY